MVLVKKKSDDDDNNNNDNGDTDLLNFQEFNPFIIPTDAPV